ncbi:MAG: response regulator [Gemmatimonadales bacterium]|nr:response regulator [Gemmatimonadales bacterium]
MRRAARILVVDDEPAIRALVTRALQSAKYEVISMNDGAAGLDPATTAEMPFDLIVTNNHMPHMSGAEMIAELRRHFPGQSILHLDDLSLPQSPALPADIPNLYKPFSVDLLLSEVERLLSRRR